MVVFPQKILFNSRVELRIEYVVECKQCHLLGSEEFPTLENILILNFPKVILKTPIKLSILKMFQVIGCPKVFDDPLICGDLVPSKVLLSRYKWGTIVKLSCQVEGEKCNVLYQ